MPTEPSDIARAADELGSADVAVSAIAAHLADAGTWDSAFDEWNAASGRFINRLGIHTAATFRRGFGPWLISFQEQTGGTGQGATAVL